MSAFDANAVRQQPFSSIPVFYLLLPSFLYLCGFSFLSGFVLVLFFCQLSSLSLVFLWLLLWSMFLLCPSFVVVHNFPRVLVSVTVSFCIFVFVCDGVFNGWQILIANILLSASYDT